MDDYRYIRNDITELTEGLPLYHSILSAIALGDGKEHAVFKRANVSQSVGRGAIEALVEKKIIQIHKVKTHDDRFYFTTPFLHFWFAFVSPLFKGVRDGDYSEVKKRWENYAHDFFAEAFSRLARDMVKKMLTEEKVMRVMPLYTENEMFDLFVESKSDTTILGTIKYTNAKLKKNELTKLQERAQTANISADSYIIVAKKGFSSELKALKGEKLKLFTLKNFKVLVE